MVDHNVVLAENLRAARRACDLSQEAVALVAGIDRTCVCGIERGRRNPSLMTIVKLAEHVKTTPAELLTPVER